MSCARVGDVYAWLRLHFAAELACRREVAEKARRDSRAGTGVLHRHAYLAGGEGDQLDDRRGMRGDRQADLLTPLAQEDKVSDLQLARGGDFAGCVVACLVVLLRLGGGCRRFLGEAVERCGHCGHVPLVP